jgi:hypothetical protein
VPSGLGTVRGWLVSYPFKWDGYLRGNFVLGGSFSFAILEADVDGLGLESRNGVDVDGLGFKSWRAVGPPFFKIVIPSLEPAVAVKNAEAVCYLAVHC